MSLISGSWNGKRRYYHMRWQKQEHPPTFLGERPGCKQHRVCLWILQRASCNGGSKREKKWWYYPKIFSTAGSLGGRCGMCLHIGKGWLLSLCAGQIWYILLYYYTSILLYYCTRFIVLNFFTGRISLRSRSRRTCSDGNGNGTDIGNFCWR